MSDLSTGRNIYLGETKRLVVRTYDESDGVRTPADADTVSLIVIKPSGRGAVEVQRVAPGVYQVDYTFAEAGQYRFVAKSTGEGIVSIAPGTVNVKDPE